MDELNRKLPKTLRERQELILAGLAIAIAIGFGFEIERLDAKDITKPISIPIECFPRKDPRTPCEGEARVGVPAL